jgi:hypothetical protein
MMQNWAGERQTLETPLPHVGRNAILAPTPATVHTKAIVDFINREYSLRQSRQAHWSCWSCRPSCESRTVVCAP